VAAGGRLRSISYRLPVSPKRGIQPVLGDSSVEAAKACWNSGQPNDMFGDKPAFALQTMRRRDVELTAGSWDPGVGNVCCPEVMSSADRHGTGCCIHGVVEAIPGLVETGLQPVK
jgi:hypothetical protein